MAPLYSWFYARNLKNAVPDVGGVGDERLGVRGRVQSDGGGIERRSEGRAGLLPSIPRWLGQAGQGRDDGAAAARRWGGSNAQGKARANDPGGTDRSAVTARRGKPRGAHPRCRGPHRRR